MRCSSITMDIKEVFVIMKTFILTQMFIVMNLSYVTSQVHFNGSVYLECPSGSYQVQFTSNCTSVCPSHTPFNVSYWCLDFCPIGNEYPECTHDTPRVTSERLIRKPIFRCRKGFCPKERPFCFDYQCLLECPTGTINDDTLCVSHCSNSKALVFNNSCVTDCPSNKPLNESGVCVSECSNINVRNNKTCVRVCPTDMFRYNKTCRAVCPKEASFIVEAFDTKFCLNSCPDITFLDGYICKTACPKGLEFLWNRTCMESCPDVAPLVYVMKRRFPFGILICIASCPGDMFSDGITCVHTCDKRMYVFNASCVYNCPSDHKLLEGSAPPYTCMEQCRPHQKLYHNHCVEKCPDGMLLSNSSCLSKCPKENSTIYNGTCVSKCPINLVDDSGVCTEQCIDSEYVLNQVCVTSCPLKYVVKFISWQPYTKFCVTSCDTNIGPDWYRYECRCAGSLLLFNNTCETKCPSLYPIVYNGKCLVECPDGFVAYNGKCQSSCPKNTSYVINNNVCAEMCPSSHQYFATLQTWNSYEMTFVSSSCLDKCAEQNFAEISYNMDCIDTCPDKTVIFGVPRCIHNCSSDESIYRRTFYSHYHIYICVKECPDTSFKWKNHCYDQCPYYLPSYQPNRTCIEECPKDTFHVQNTCNKTCNGYIFNRTECVHYCPRNAPFVLGQNCVSKCPVSHVLNQHGRCVETCLPNVKLNRTCYRTCPDSSPIVLNNTCVKECPKTFNLTAPSPQGFICVNECKPPLVRDGNRCTVTCGQKLVVNNVCENTTKCPDSFRFVENSTRGLTAPSPQGFICVNECKPPLVRDGNRCTVTCGQKLVVNNVCENTTKCPDSFRFVENSTRGQICRKKCTEKQFNFNEVWCVRKCPNFALGQRCLDHCPPSHPYTFHEKYAKEKDSTRCYSNCPTITFGAFCVDSCPESHRAVESTRTCEKTCPASDPIKTDSMCLQPCSITESFSKLEQKCIPMSPGLVAAIVVTCVIAVLSVIGVFFMCKTPTTPRNKSNSPDAAAMADESAKPQKRENTNNSVKYECATSTIHFEGDLSQHGRGSDTEKDLTGATMDTTETETGLDNSGFSDPETSNIQVRHTGRNEIQHGNVYDCEMNINEKTNLKEKVK